MGISACAQRKRLDAKTSVTSQRCCKREKKKKNQHFSNLVESKFDSAKTAWQGAAFTEDH